MNPDVKNPLMKIAGLTGGIGAGKSVVAKIFSELGAYVIDADELSRRIVEPGKPAWQEIKESFGEEILLPDQSINRKKLAEIIFSSPEKKKLLEKITHPRIGEEILKELEKAKNSSAPLAIIDAALLLESPLKNWVKPVILVIADEKIRVQRVCQRDGVSPEEVYARIRSQASDQERMKKADFIIENNASLSELRDAVNKIFYQIINS